MEKHNRPDLDNEMDELQRVVQDLSRDEDITVSVDELVNVFKNAKEVTLSDEIWGNLENTESNEIEKGDMDSVMNIAKTYKKTNPKKLVQVIKSGDYKKPDRSLSYRKAKGMKIGKAGKSKNSEGGSNG